MTIIQQVMANTQSKYLTITNKNSGNEFAFELTFSSKYNDFNVRVLYTNLSKKYIGYIDNEGYTQDGNHTQPMLALKWFLDNSDKDFISYHMHTVSWEQYLNK